MNTNPTIRVVIANQNSNARYRLRTRLMAIPKEEADVIVVGQADNTTTLFQRCEQLHPDIVLLDPALPDVGGAEITQAIRERWPDIQIIITLSGSAPEQTPQMAAAMAAGASAYVTETTSTDELIAAIRDVANQAPPPLPTSSLPSDDLPPDTSPPSWIERLFTVIQGQPLWAVAVLIAILVVIATPFLALRLFAQRGNAPPTEIPSPSIDVAPTEVSGGALIVVTGSNWQPGDVVFVRLDSTAPAMQKAIASVTVGEDGTFVIPFLYPLEEEWIRLSSVVVTVQSPATGKQISQALSVIFVSPTPPAITPTITTTITPTETTVSPTPLVITQWRGEYYTNLTLSGGVTVLRDDPAINFNWGMNSPATGIPADNFSARWTRILPFEAGKYRFSVRSDDGVRVWLDEELIIDEWHAGMPVTHIAERELSTGDHTIRVEYYEQTGAAEIRLWWERVGDFPQWRGEYFPTVDLTGASAVVRNDSTITFDWGSTAPADTLPADNFSARWTRSLSFDQGTYRFHALVDDGMRLFIDDVLVLDEWKDGGRREVAADYTLAAGVHTLMVEYYERVGNALIQVWWEKSRAFPDWHGAYWSNRGLEGQPSLERNDPNIDFEWGWLAPADGLPADNFSARWTRQVSFAAGTYRFHFITDDGARLWVDNQLLIDDWQDGAPRQQSAEIGLTAGSHDVRLEYYEHVGNAQIRLWWEQVANPIFTDWQGEYWANQTMNGVPALVRNDPSVDFDWKDGAPAVGLPTDNFSARWSRSMNFEAGLYRFQVRADDGVRIYVDGQLILDEWHTGDGSIVYTTEQSLSGGSHRLEVHYYEHGGNALIQLGWQRIGDMPTATFTPTPTPSSMPTAQATASSTPAITPPPTPTGTPVSTPEPTPTIITTSTATPTATISPTVTATMVPSPTTVPIETPTPTATPSPTATQPIVWINEIYVPDPQIQGEDEWVELYNADGDQVDLDGWVLQAGETLSHSLSIGSLLPPGAFVVLYGQQTGLSLEDAGGELRLIRPDATLADIVQYPPISPTHSYSRDSAGVWHTDWPPSPGEPNAPPSPTELPPASIVVVESQASMEKQAETARKTLVPKLK